MKTHEIWNFLGRQSNNEMPTQADLDMYNQQKHECLLQTKLLHLQESFRIKTAKIVTKIEKETFCYPSDSAVHQHFLDSIQSMDEFESIQCELNSLLTELDPKSKHVNSVLKIIQQMQNPECDYTPLTLDDIERPELPKNLGLPKKSVSTIKKADSTQPEPVTIQRPEIIKNESNAPSFVYHEKILTVSDLETNISKLCMLDNFSNLREKTGKVMTKRFKKNKLDKAFYKEAIEFFYKYYKDVYNIQQEDLELYIDSAHPEDYVTILVKNNKRTKKSKPAIYKACVYVIALPNREFLPTKFEEPEYI